MHSRNYSWGLGELSCDWQLKGIRPICVHFQGCNTLGCKLSLLPSGQWGHILKGPLCMCCCHGLLQLGTNGVKRMSCVSWFPELTVNTSHSPTDPLLIMSTACRVPLIVHSLLDVPAGERSAEVESEHVTNDTRILLLAAVPYVGGVAAHIVNALHSHKVNERR